MAMAAKPRHAAAAGGYKWTALSNTALAMLMATINQTTLIISLPAIFHGLDVNPMHSGQTSLLLRILIGFNVATTILLVSFGRISDTFGRVRLYNLGYAILTDVFCANERGPALGLNRIAALGGGVMGLVVGGQLSAIYWRAVFLVNVSVGLFGTIWTYIAFRETATTRDAKRMDWWGNLTFAAGLMGAIARGGLFDDKSI